MMCPEIHIDPHRLIRDELPRIDIFSAEEKARLVECQNVFTEHMKEIVPGTGAYRRELERLGIDLSWKSAQIEGNIYTLIETETLLNSDRHSLEDCP